MEIPTRQDIIALMEEREGPHISIYMPTRVAGPETRENPIRFKNMLTQAERGLEEMGLAESDIKELLRPIAGLEDDYDYWQNQSEGLAIFLSKDGAHRYRLPMTMPEVTLVQPRFHLKPLLPLLSADFRFHVLAISGNSTRLLDCTPFTQEEVQVEDMPDGIEDALWSDDPQKQLQFRSFYSGASGQTTLMHGAASNEPDQKDDLLRYFHIVDRAVTRFMNAKGGPLVLACVDYLAPIYRETNEYNGLLDSHVSGSPDRQQDDELRAAAWELLRPRFEEQRESARERYRANVGTGLTTSRVSEAALAAATGKVDTAFVTVGMQRWGRIDKEAYKVEDDDESDHNNYDLLDMIAAHTLMAGGTVYAVEPEDALEPTGVSAIFRYA